MARKLNLTVSGALQSLADLTPGYTSLTLTRMLLRAAAAIEDARPALSGAERDLVTFCLRDLLELRPDELPSPARLAAEIHDALGEHDIWPGGVRAGFVETVATWPIATIWAFADDLDGGLIAQSARAGAATPRGRPTKAE